MDEKTFQTLEYSKILERLASLAAFAPSAEKARNLRPTNDLEEVPPIEGEPGGYIVEIHVHVFLFLHV